MPDQRLRNMDAWDANAADSLSQAPDVTGLVNKYLVRAWLWWSLAWLSVFPLVGLLVSIKFHLPDFLGETSWLTFGRLRPVHVNGVIFGAFSTPVLGLLYYLVPRLCGRPMVKEHWGWPLLWGWNFFLVAGSLSLMMGYNTGFEAGEYEWPINILRWIILAAIGYQVLATIFTRKEKGFYVALWYTLAALVWTAMNLILGNVVLPYVPMSGISNAALHGLYIHYVVGLWITPAGLALMYYFLPLAARAPLYSHRLSLLGFWALAFFYPFVGTHHYLFSPIPYHNQTISIVTSMMLIIPVWAVITNLFGTARGRWGAIVGGNDADSYAAKFLLLATFFYLVGCFQGSTEALRRVQELTHFTDFVISHSHFTVFATFVLAAVGSMYYVWPRVTGRRLWSAKLASWHVWLTIAGTTIMLAGLAAQGFIQGSMLEYGANFVDSVVEMKPWWFARTLAGASMDLGLLLMAVNLVMTAREGVPFEMIADSALLAVSEARPAAVGATWYSRPSGVFIVAGIAFFFLAVLIQGILPSILPQTYNPTVVSASSGQIIQVADYTLQERRGRQVYIREGCWYCHSQYVRPVTGENLRWGPVSQAGEYVYDQPQMLSTRRIGPDLLRVGGKYGDDWQAAHHWNPRDVVPDSVMPRFPWLFKDSDGKTAPQLNEDGLALVAYLQKLGTSIGDWRETFVSTRLTSGAALRSSYTETMQDLLPRGKQVYLRRCVGCHGEKGDGNGPSARFMNPKPRDFTTGTFKFRSTAGDANSLPSDGDLFVTISHGLWGTAMPSWFDIPVQERLAVIQYIKTFSARWRTARPGAPVPVGDEPPVSVDSIARGKQQFDTICAACHGLGGLGDGMPAGVFSDMWGNPVNPANFTLPAGAPGGVKLGHDGRHVYRTIMTGVGGTPMPAFAGTFTPEQIWDIVHYMQSLRVDAHLASLKQAGMTEPEQAANFCTSSVPWLLAACSNVVLPIINFCSAGGPLEAKAAGTKLQLADARARIWASLSEAADHGQIDAQVVQVDRPGIPVIDTAKTGKGRWP
ncbi:MAG: cbb3-type cytochrome c oxidase subunit I [Nitrosomonadales bacterium]|nr:cbb3-type cytochrome c oxidase subunit I [Nitrosomonadales bacterium]